MRLDELLILFSSYVIAFILIWFTNIAEDPRETKGKTEERVQAHEHVTTLPNEMVWNVGTFFGLRASNK
jgi:cyanate permease